MAVSSAFACALKWVDKWGERYEQRGCWVSFALSKSLGKEGLFKERRSKSVTFAKTIISGVAQANQTKERAKTKSSYEFRPFL